MKNVKICFIGGGNMATAIISGLFKKYGEDLNIHLIDHKNKNLEEISKKFKISTSCNFDESIRSCDVIILAIKPQQMKEVAISLRPYTQSQIVLSVAAGIRIVDLTRWLSGYKAIVRCMPNMPAAIGLGITGIVASLEVSQSQFDIVVSIMQSIGETVVLDNERLIDAVTAISGSGPAFVFYFIEAMIQAAVELGLSYEQGRKLAINTFIGASHLVNQSDESISILRQKVTSKGGTTHAGLSSMDSYNVKNSIGMALGAASIRASLLAVELGIE
jgi:pyrroline-5-carboxylate reductase